MRPFQTLDASSLKAFYFAAHSLHFTRAAKAASLTQSGISQHIKKLESELGALLFHRTGKKVQLTPAGQELLRYVDFHLDSVEGLKERLHSYSQNIAGTVRYAMPDSCLYTPHFPLLLDKRIEKFPEVQLKIKICASEEVMDLLRKREIDFGFVTKDLRANDVDLRHFATEEYVLVSANPDWLEISGPQQIVKLPFICYPGVDALFAHWHASEFPRHKIPNFCDLNLAGDINSIKGALIMASKGVGVSIFQAHCVQDLTQDGKIHFYSSNRNRYSKNKVFLVTNKNDDLPLRVREVINAFWAMKS